MAATTKVGDLTVGAKTVSGTVLSVTVMGSNAWVAFDQDGMWYENVLNAQALIPLKSAS